MVGVHRSGVGAGRPTFVVGDALRAGLVLTLDDAATRHARVLRLDVGAVVGLRDGQGGVAEGRLTRVAKQGAQVEVDQVIAVAPPPPLHLLVPVADRDRMLWLAEKASELACTSWRPVLWQRSKSVSPRGEGVTFTAKVRARMEHALAQSEGAWLPQLFPEAPPERAVLAAPPGDRVVLHPEGEPMCGPGAPAIGTGGAAVTLAIGPEGGFETAELELLEAHGFRPASIGRTILRFETAAIAALGIARTAMPAVAGHSSDHEEEP